MECGMRKNSWNGMKVVESLWNGMEMEFKFSRFWTTISPFLWFFIFEDETFKPENLLILIKTNLSNKLSAPTFIQL